MNSRLFAALPLIVALAALSGMGGGTGTAYGQVPDDPLIPFNVSMITQQEISITQDTWGDVLVSFENNDNLGIRGLSCDEMEHLMLGSLPLVQSDPRIRQSVNSPTPWADRIEGLNNPKLARDGIADFYYYTDGTHPSGEFEFMDDDSILKNDGLGGFTYYLGDIDFFLNKYDVDPPPTFNVEGDMAYFSSDRRVVGFNQFEPLVDQFDYRDHLMVVYEIGPQLNERRSSVPTISAIYEIPDITGFADIEVLDGNFYILSNDATARTSTISIYNSTFHFQSSHALLNDFGFTEYKRIAINDGRIYAVEDSTQKNLSVYVYNLDDFSFDELVFQSFEIGSGENVGTYVDFDVDDAYFYNLGYTQSDAAGGNRTELYILDKRTQELVYHNDGNIFSGGVNDFDLFYQDSLADTTFNIYNIEIAGNVLYGQASYIDRGTQTLVGIKSYEITRPSALPEGFYYPSLREGTGRIAYEGHLIDSRFKHEYMVVRDSRITAAGASDGRYDLRFDNAAFFDGAEEEISTYLQNVGRNEWYLYSQADHQTGLEMGITNFTLSMPKAVEIPMSFFEIGTPGAGMAYVYVEVPEMRYYPTFTIGVKHYRDSVDPLVVTQLENSFDMYRIDRPGKYVLAYELEGTYHEIGDVVTISFTTHGGDDADSNGLSSTTFPNNIRGSFVVDGVTVRPNSVVDSYSGVTGSRNNAIVNAERYAWGPKILVGASVYPSSLGTSNLFEVTGSGFSFGQYAFHVQQFPRTDHAIVDNVGGQAYYAFDTKKDLRGFSETPLDGVSQGPTFDTTRNDVLFGSSAIYSQLAPVPDPSATYSDPSYMWYSLNGLSSTNTGIDHGNDLVIPYEAVRGNPSITCRGFTMAPGIMTPVSVDHEQMIRTPARAFSPPVLEGDAPSPVYLRDASIYNDTSYENRHTLVCTDPDERQSTLVFDPPLDSITGDGLTEVEIYCRDGNFPNRESWRSERQLTVRIYVDNTPPTIDAVLRPGARSVGAVDAITPAGPSIGFPYNLRCWDIDEGIGPTDRLNWFPTFLTKGSPDYGTPGDYVTGHECTNFVGETSTFNATVYVRSPPDIIGTPPPYIHVRSINDYNHGITCSDSNPPGPLPGEGSELHSYPNIIDLTAPLPDGNYTIDFRCESDATGYHSENRTGYVYVDSVRPSLVVTGGNAIIELGGPYNRPTVTCIDAVDGPITDIRNPTSIDVNQPDSQTDSYECRDRAGNVATNNFVVFVEAPPELASTPTTPVYLQTATDYLVSHPLDCIDRNQATSDNSPLVDPVLFVDPTLESLTADGNHTVQFYCRDQTNRESARATVAIIVDNTPPVITGVVLRSTYDVGQPYAPAPVTCTDTLDSRNPIPIIRDNRVDTSRPGTYSDRYTCTNLAGLTSGMLATVFVAASPELLGEAPTPVHLRQATDYDHTLVCVDANVDEDVTLVVTPPLDTLTSDGNYQVTYQCRDESGRTSESRTVNIIVDNTGPVMQGVPENDVYVGIGTDYDTPDVTCSDDLDSRLDEIPVTETSSLDTDTAGNYTIQYSCTNEAQITTSESFRVLVRGAPTISALDAIYYVNSTDRFVRPVCTDPNDPPLSVMLESLPPVRLRNDYASFDDVPDIESSSGNYRFYCVNEAGLSSPRILTRVIIDQTPPVMSKSGDGFFTAADDGTTTKFYFWYQSVDPIRDSGITCSDFIDGEQVPLTVMWDGIVERGDNIKTFWCIDRAGNRAQHDFRIFALNAPTITPDPPPSPVYLMNATHYLDDVTCASNTPGIESTLDIRVTNYTGPVDPRYPTDARGDDLRSIAVDGKYATRIGCLMPIGPNGQGGFDRSWSWDIIMVVDSTKPVLRLTGGDAQVSLGFPYTSPTATCTDTRDGVIQPVNTARPDTSTIGWKDDVWTCTDRAGNVATETHRVFVNAVPVVTGAVEPEIFLNMTGLGRYVDPLGCTDLNSHSVESVYLSTNTAASNPGEITTEGIYPFMFYCEDELGLQSPIIEYTIYYDESPPVLSGGPPQPLDNQGLPGPFNVGVGSVYNYPVTCTDTISSPDHMITVENPIRPDLSRPGSYEDAYSCENQAGLINGRVFDVHVYERPVLVGQPPADVFINATDKLIPLYEAAGMDCRDDNSFTLAVEITIEPRLATFTSDGNHTVNILCENERGVKSAEKIQTWFYLDTMVPDLELTGGSTQLFVGEAYDDPNVFCIDPPFDPLSDRTVFVTRDTPPDTSTPGEKIDTYTCTDRAGNSITRSHTVTVMHGTLSITGNAPSGRYVMRMSDYTHTVMCMHENTARPSMLKIMVNGTEISSFSDVIGDGNKTVEFHCADNDGRQSDYITVWVYVDSVPPILNVLGGDTRVPVDGAYNEPATRCRDEVSGTLTVEKEGMVDTSIIRVQTVTYSCTDQAGNTDEEMRSVTIFRAADVGGGIYDVTDPNNLRFEMEQNARGDVLFSFLNHHEYGVKMVDCQEYENLLVDSLPFGPYHRTPGLELNFTSANLDQWHIHRDAHNTPKAPTTGIVDFYQYYEGDKPSPDYNGGLVPEGYITQYLEQSVDTFGGYAEQLIDARFKPASITMWAEDSDGQRRHFGIIDNTRFEPDSRANIQGSFGDTHPAVFRSVHYPDDLSASPTIVEGYFAGTIASPSEGYFSAAGSGELREMGTHAAMALAASKLSDRRGDFYAYVEVPEMRHYPTFEISYGRYQGGGANPELQIKNEGSMVQYDIVRPGKYILKYDMTYNDVQDGSNQFIFIEYTTRGLDRTSVTDLAGMLPNGEEQGQWNDPEKLAGNDTLAFYEWGPKVLMGINMVPDAFDLSNVFEVTGTGYTFGPYTYQDTSGTYRSRSSTQEAFGTLESNVGQLFITVTGKRPASSVLPNIPDYVIPVPDSFITQSASSETSVNDIYGNVRIHEQVTVLPDDGFIPNNNNEYSLPPVMWYAVNNVGDGVRGIGNELNFGNSMVIPYANVNATSLHCKGIVKAPGLTLVSDEHELVVRPPSMAPKFTSDEFTPTIRVPDVKGIPVTLELDQNEYGDVIAYMNSRSYGYGLHALSCDEFAGIVLDGLPTGLVQSTSPFQRYNSWTEGNDWASYRDGFNTPKNDPRGETPGVYDFKYFRDRGVINNPPTGFIWPGTTTSYSLMDYEYEYEYTTAPVRVDVGKRPACTDSRVQTACIPYSLVFGIASFHNKQPGPIDFSYGAPSSGGGRTDLGIDNAIPVLANLGVDFDTLPSLFTDERTTLRRQSSTNYINTAERPTFVDIPVANLEHSEPGRTHMYIFVNLPSMRNYPVFEVSHKFLLREGIDREDPSVISALSIAKVIEERNTSLYSLDRQGEHLIVFPADPIRHNRAMFDEVIRIRYTAESDDRQTFSWTDTQSTEFRVGTPAGINNINLQGNYYGNVPIGGTNPEGYVILEDSGVHRYRAFIEPRAPTLAELADLPHLADSRSEITMYEWVHDITVGTVVFPDVFSRSNAFMLSGYGYGFGSISQAEVNAGGTANFVTAVDNQKGNVYVHYDTRSDASIERNTPINRHLLNHIQSTVFNSSMIPDTNSGFSSVDTYVQHQEGSPVDARITPYDLWYSMTPFIDTNPQTQQGGQSYPSHSIVIPRHLVDDLTTLTCRAFVMNPGFSSSPSPDDELQLQRSSRPIGPIPPDAGILNVTITDLFPPNPNCPTGLSGQAALNAGGAGCRIEPPPSPIIEEPEPVMVKQNDTMSIDQFDYQVWRIAVEDVGKITIDKDEGIVQDVDGEIIRDKDGNTMKKFTNMTLTQEQREIIEKRLEFGSLEEPTHMVFQAKIGVPSSQAGQQVMIRDGKAVNPKNEQTTRLDGAIPNCEAYDTVTGEKLTDIANVAEQRDGGYIYTAVYATDASYANVALRCGFPEAENTKDGGWHSLWRGQELRTAVQSSRPLFITLVDWVVEDNALGLGGAINDPDSGGLNFGTMPVLAIFAIFIGFIGFNRDHLPSAAIIYGFTIGFFTYIGWLKIPDAFVGFIFIIIVFLIFNRGLRS
ncbi:MAG: DUF5011 domain-containing protein [Alphaproteobacteria bacterium]|nr:DUF5011 domain-containing protein [Alphaproteobacteria bacterium]MDA8029600.1 DUF5011 domain-containing protein [Alphaproteobacteria bacterium]